MIETKPTENEQLAVSEKQAAALLNVCPKTVFNLTTAGKLPCFRIGRRKLYSRATLQKFIAEQETLCSSGQTR